MIPQELIDRGQKVGLSKEELPAETTTIKTTLIGNGFEVECPKIVGTNLADHLVANKIEVYEIRFPMNKSHALIYGRLNPDVELEEVVNQYSKEHGY